MSIEKNRRNNLKRILTERFNAKQKDLAYALGMKDAQLSNLLNGHANIGNAIARRIENALELEINSLDYVKENFITAYTLIKTHHSSVSVLKGLQKNQFVQEAALIYGSEWDLFIKSELPADELQFLLIKRLYNENPSIKNTYTFVALNDYHWQQEQEKKELSENIDFFDSEIDLYEDANIIDQYRANIIGGNIPDPFIKKYFPNIIEKARKEIADALQGKVYLYKSSEAIRWMLNAMRNVQESMDATHLYEENKSALHNSAFQSEYFKIQEIATQRGVKFRRLFILNNDVIIEEDQELLSMMREQQSWEIEVKWIYKKHWVKEYPAENPKDFTIWDKKYVYLNEVPKTEDNWKPNSISSKPEDIEQYSQIFEVNFLNGNKFS